MGPRRPGGQRDLWVVLPARGIGRGKTRLAGVLDASERVRLNRSLLLHSLRVLERWLGGLERCVVISPCARTLRLARSQGALGLVEPRPCAGLNVAVGHAVRDVFRAGARRVLVLPCDLPLLSTSALDALRAAGTEDARVVIAPDRSGTGTNALLLQAAARFAFSFGPDSFALHRRAAHARGWVFAVCDCPELAMDLDTPEDLAAWSVRGAERWGR